MVSSVSAVSTPPSMGTLMCQIYCRVYTRIHSMSRKPSSIYSQKCASLRTMWVGQALGQGRMAQTAQSRRPE